MIQLTKTNSTTYYSNYPHLISYLAILTASIPYRAVKTNQKGRLLENIINNNNNNLYLFNTKSLTHINPSSTTYSAIDLILCNTLIFLDNIELYGDTCRSDYFLIVIESLQPQVKDLPQWKLYQANWEEFQSLWVKQLIPNKTYSTGHFTDKVIDIAKTCIPHKPTTHKRDRPWFSKECKKAIRL